MRLYCDAETLEQRVGTAERRTFNKLTRVEDLRGKLRSLVEPFAAVGTRASLAVSTQTLTPNEAALEIATKLELPNAAS